MNQLTFNCIGRLRSGYKGHHIGEGSRPRVITRLDTELVLSPLVKLSNLVRCGGTIKGSDKTAQKDTK